MHGPGDHLLPCSCVSSHQDGSTIPGKNPDHLIDLDHPGISANHLPGPPVGLGAVGIFAVGLRLLGGGSVDLLVAQTTIHNGQEFLEPYRLNEVVERPGLHGLHGGDHGVVSRHDNHIDVLHGLPDPAQELQPGHAIHAYIGDDQSRIEGADLGQRDLRAVGFVNFVTRIFELLSKNGSEVGVVVDQKDARHVGSFLEARF